LQTVVLILFVVGGGSFVGVRFLLLTRAICPAFTIKSI
jgi:hypothetical protein